VCCGFLAVSLSLSLSLWPSHPFSGSLVFSVSIPLTPSFSLSLCRGLPAARHDFSPSLSLPLVLPPSLDSSFIKSQATITSGTAVDDGAQTKPSLTITFDEEPFKGLGLIEGGLKTAPTELEVEKDSLQALTCRAIVFFFAR